MLFLPRPSGVRGPIRPFAKSKDINTCEYYGSDCATYANANGVLTYGSSLTSGLVNPQGTVADSAGNWYIANTGAFNIPVYDKGGVLKKTLLDAGQFPGDVAVNTARKLVAVSNLLTKNFTSGSVSLYENGAKKPNGSLSVTDQALGIGVAIDAAGNCFWSYNDETTSGGFVVEFFGCGGSPTTVAAGLGDAGGVAIDKGGNLFFVDQDAGVYKCSGTSNCTLFSTGYGTPLNLNFDGTGKTLWVSDMTGYVDAVDPTTGAIEVQNAASGGSSDPPLGVAPDPGLKL